MALCLAAGTVSAVLAFQSFTLAWMHSIEKIRWEEDWKIIEQIEDQRAVLKLELLEARIKGSGAGMEPPEGSVLKGGWWHYRPKIAPLPQVILAHSPYTAGYELCTANGCRALVSYLPGIAEISPIEMRPCP